MIEPMRYAAVFAILGTACLALAAQSAGGGSAVAWSLAAVEAYFAVSLFTLAVVYALNHYGVAVEQAFRHRTLARVTDALLLPYRALAAFVVFLMRRFDPMGPMDPVATRLYVGRLPLRSERRRLAEAGVTSVLNLCAEFPARPRSRLRGDAAVETVYLPLLDGEAPTRRQFEAALEWITRRHADGHTVLVHCAQGRGRSVTIAAAALCRLGLAAGPDEALAMITAARPKARPSLTQRAALASFLAAEPARAAV